MLVRVSTHAWRCILGRSPYFTSTAIAPQLCDYCNFEVETSRTVKLSLFSQASTEWLSPACDPMGPIIASVVKQDYNKFNSSGIQNERDHWCDKMAATQGAHGLLINQ